MNQEMGNEYYQAVCPLCGYTPRNIDFKEPCPSCGAKKYLFNNWYLLKNERRTVVVCFIVLFIALLFAIILHFYMDRVTAGLEAIIQMNTINYLIPGN